MFIVNKYGYVFERSEVTVDLKGCQVFDTFEQTFELVSKLQGISLEEAAYVDVWLLADVKQEEISDYIF